MAEAAPPPGPTTLIVSLGSLHTATQLAVLMLGVVLITAQGFVTNRLAGLDYPLWAPRPAGRSEAGMPPT